MGIGIGVNPCGNVNPISRCSPMAGILQSELHVGSSEAYDMSCADSFPKFNAAVHLLGSDFWNRFHEFKISSMIKFSTHACQGCALR